MKELVDSERMISNISIAIRLFSAVTETEDVKEKGETDRSKNKEKREEKE